MINLVLNNTVIIATLSTLLFLSGATAGAHELWTPEFDSMKLKARQADMDSGFHCIELHVYNNSETQAIVLDACNAECENQHAALPQEILFAVDEGERHRRRKEKALASIATAGLGCMLVAEHQDKKKGPLAWLGDQTKDRELRCRIFARRVIGPGDSTSGRLYFKDLPRHTATLRIPAMFVSRYGESNQILTVPLSHTTINPDQSETTFDTTTRRKE